MSDEAKRNLPTVGGCPKAKGLNQPRRSGLGGARKWKCINRPIRENQIQVHSTRQLGSSRSLQHNPLQSSDFKPLLNLSRTVPLSVLNPEEWRLIASTISPFKYASGTGNQNYAIQLDYGLSNKLQISGFTAKQMIHSTLKSKLDIRLGNLWKVLRADALEAAGTNISLALNGSLESWTVGSGGDSRGNNSRDNVSPNIFNDSTNRVETQNLVGSISLPLTWNSNEELQFTFNPSQFSTTKEKGRVVPEEPLAPTLT